MALVVIARRAGYGDHGGNAARGTVADFQDALDQLLQLSANVIADDLRAGLRDARQ